MASEIVSFTYKISIKDHLKQIKEDEEEIANLRRQYYAKKVEDYLVEQGYEPLTASIAANNVIFHGHKLQSNADDPDEEPAVNEWVNTAHLETNEKTLMLAFPVELKRKRSFTLDCEVRKWENENFVEKYYGDKHHPNVTYIETLWYRNLCCCCCDTCKAIESLDYRLKKLEQRMDQYDRNYTLMEDNRISVATGSA